MKKYIDPISIILRLTLGITFLLNGSNQIMQGVTVSGYNLSTLMQNLSPQFANWAYYLAFLQVVIGVMLVFGVVTRFSAILAIAWNVFFILLSPLFLKNPLIALLQLNQIVAQIGVAIAVYLVAAPSMSLDKFFFPFRPQKALNQERFESLLAFSLAISFALTFASIFLLISDDNYVIYQQWKHLVQNLPLLNMPLLASFVALAAVLLFFNYGRRTTSFAATVLFMLALLIDSRNYEVLPLFGLSLSMAIFPLKSKKLKIIPRRQPKEYI